MPDLTVLHTNDLHGKLSDKAADWIIKERALNDRCILLDAGDAISSGNISYRRDGEPILARMSDLGYNAMAMGNREFHFLETGLESKVKLAQFPVLSANLRAKYPDVQLPVLQSTSLNVRELRVIVFGLTVPMITMRMFASRLSPFWFEDPIQTAAEIVPELQKQADVLIAVTHIGLQSDMEIAASVRGIDLIVGGHSHSILQGPTMVEDTVIVQAGYWGRYVGKVEINMPERKGDHLDIRGTLIDLSTE